MSEQSALFVNWDTTARFFSDYHKGLKSIHGMRDRRYLWSVGTDGLIIASTDSGKHWVEKSRGITGIQTKDESVPQHFSLSQNYPNPFNPSTVIEYSLPKATFVSVRVYDLLGREVGSIVSERQGAGRHEALFNGDGLSSGVYFYRIQTPEFIQAKKMLYMR